VKAFRLDIGSAGQDFSVVRNEISSPASPVDFQTLDEAWRHGGEWLAGRGLCGAGQIEDALGRLERRRATGEPAGPFALSLLHELRGGGCFSEIPREAAGPLFRQQRWDFIRDDFQSGFEGEEHPELAAVLSPLGIVVIGFSKRILTIAHSDPWLAHLGMRRLQTTPKGRALGVVNLPTETHQALFEHQHQADFAIESI
jgi:hypothetical protein